MDWNTVRSVNTVPIAALMLVRSSMSPPRPCDWIAVAAAVLVATAAGWLFLPHIAGYILRLSLRVVLDRSGTNNVLFGQETERLGCIKFKQPLRASSLNEGLERTSEIKWRNRSDE